MENQVHIIPKKVEEGQKYDPRQNSLILKKATSFNIAIKEIEALKKQKPVAPNPITELSKEEYNKLNKTGKWNYEVDVRQYNIDVKKYSEKLRLYNEQLKKFDDLIWTWQLVYSGLDPNKITRNIDFKKGIHDRISFPKLLEGGGIAWLEAWHEKEKPKGASPFGMYVQAEGIPEIIRTEWTDCRYQTISQSTTVAFRSKVILHIYTAGLYGQEVEIYLVDSNIFTPDKKLKISGDEFFNREVKVYKLKANDIDKKGISGVLTIDDAPVNYAQKIEIEVTLDSAWRKTAGDNLKIFPVVKSIKTGAFFTGFSRNYLQVSTNKKSITLDEQSLPTTNMPLIVGNVETNVSAFHHCQYTEITFEYEKDKKKEVIEVFKENPTILYNSNAEIGLILGSEPKKFSIKVDGKSNTDECRYAEEPKDHGKNIFTFDKAKIPKNISIIKHESKSFEGTAFFDYNKIKLFDYFFLTDSKLKNLPRISLDANTCRHKNKINFVTVPDIKWEAYILIMSKTSESYSHTGMPNDKDSFGDPIVTENGKPTRKNIFQIHQKKARETGISAKKMAKDFTGELHIKASTNNGADSHDFGANIEDKLNVILSTLSDIKKVLDEISHRDEAVKGDAQQTMQTLKNKNLIGSKLPVFIEFSFPTIRLGGGWYWDIDKKDEKIKCIGNLQFGFEPLVQGKGGIDLVAAAEYIPIVKPVLVALRYVKVGAQWMSDNTPVKIDSELYFNLYVKGKIDLRQTIDFINSTNDKTDAKISLLLGIELGFKIKASISKVIYTKSDKSGGEEISKTGFDGQLSAEAESGIVGIGTGGRDEKGMYLQFSADFTGITLKVVGKLTIHRGKKQPQNYGINDKFDLVNYYKDICKTEKHYVL